MVTMTIEKLFELAVFVDPNDIYYDIYSGCRKKLNPKIFFRLNPHTFNTCNGLISFTDNGKELYSIPKFEGFIELLEENGYNCNYALPVPLANNLSPSSKSLCWEKLLKSFKESKQFSFSA